MTFYRPREVGDSVRFVTDFDYEVYGKLIEKVDSHQLIVRALGAQVTKSEDVCGRYQPATCDLH